jgi:hypothetical protein
MDIEKAIENIDRVISEAKLYRKMLSDQKKKSDKAFNTNHTNATPKQIQRVSADLNWHCMHTDKQKRALWKAIAAADLETGTDEVEYRPSGFHVYKG